eukprot:scaffold38693_cov150-Skeletonema_dohrnii-CCMP3373.AAC.2
MVAAKDNQQVRLLRTQVIHIYDDDDDDDVCLNICNYCRKTLLKMRYYDRRKRRTVFFSCVFLLLLLMVLLVTTFVRESGSVIVTDDGRQQSAAAIVADESAQLQYNSTDTIISSAAAASTPSAVTIPEPFNTTIANINEPFESGRDIPYFFHIPRALGSTVKDILGRCAYVRIAWNVTATMEGLKHARDTQLVQSGQVDMIPTQYLHEGATLFDGQEHRGRCFTFMRHPIERAVSLFHYLGIASHEPTYDPQLRYISIEMWARSKRIEHNWMTRFLSNELLGDLTPRHLEIAKAVLRQKCLVGLMEEKSESWLRFQKFFGWQFYTQEMRECRDELLNWKWSGKHRHDLVPEDSPAWELLYKQNILDMELYDYARQLFVEQRSLFKSD